MVAVHGVTRNGAKRWFRIAGITVQPSEYAKLALVVFLAWILSKRVGKLEHWNELFVPLGAAGAMAGLIVLQPNFSMSAMFGAIALAMLLVAGIAWRRIFEMVVLLIPVALVTFLAKGYRADRLTSFLQGHNDGKGFQAWQSLVALGNGGFFGEGLGRGTAKLMHLPEPYTDTIFAVLGEELGLVGTLFVLGLFAILAWRGLRIALLSRDRFHSLLAAGLTTALTLNACLHAMVCTRLMPTTGQPMPFVSYGGTSLMLSMGALGLLLYLSRRLDEVHDEPVAALPPESSSTRTARALTSRRTSWA
jgi:cell division protein FtsW